MNQDYSVTQVQVQENIQVQQQKLTAQQMLVVQMLQLGTLEMEERVRTELQENPALEEIPEEERYENENDTGDNGNEDITSELDGKITDAGDNDSDNDDYGDSDDTYDYRSKGTIREEIPFDAGTSFYDELLEQLHEQPLNDEEQEVGVFILGLLDDNGFLTMDPTRIVDELAFKEAVYVDQSTVDKVLGCIRSFDPAGIGARDLRECLQLQLFRKKPSENVRYALQILNDHYDDFSSQHWDRIAPALGISKATADSAIAELTTLNPRPGCSLSETVGKGMQQIIPDFLLEDNGGHVICELNNSNIPELRVNSDFHDMLDDQKKRGTKETKEAALFLQQKIDKAKSFIDALSQRNKTMRAIMSAIAKVQEEFFVTGDKDTIQPLILEDIATRTGYDISTISRVCADKYVQTNFGVYPLRLFFSNRRVQVGTGEFVNTNDMLKALQQLIEEEDKNSPYTDEQLAHLMSEKGFNVARRTMVKYREKLGIPTAAKRKRG